MKFLLLVLTLTFPYYAASASVCDISVGTLGTSHYEFEKKRRPNATPRQKIPDDISVQVYGRERCPGDAVFSSAVLTFRFIEQQLSSIVIRSSSADKGQLLAYFKNRFGQGQSGGFSKYTVESEDYWWDLDFASLSYRAKQFPSHWNEYIYLSSRSIRPSNSLTGRESSRQDQRQ